MPLLTDLIDDPYIKNVIGWSIIVIIALNIFTNAIYIFIENIIVLKQIFRNIKRYFIKRKALQKQKIFSDNNL